MITFVKNDGSKITYIFLFNKKEICCYYPPLSPPARPPNKYFFISYIFLSLNVEKDFPRYCVL